MSMGLISILYIYLSDDVFGHASLGNTGRMVRWENGFDMTGVLFMLHVFGFGGNGHNINGDCVVETKEVKYGI